MRKRKKTISLWIWLPVLAVAAWLIYQIPFVHRAVDWRVERASAYLRGVVNPAGPVPTARATADGPQQTAAKATEEHRLTPTATLTATATGGTATAEGPTATAVPPTPTLTPTPIPPAVALNAPNWEKQDMNNCGPATLAMYLRYYGWEGDQFTISDLIKPLPEDRNVNPEELTYYVRNRAGWLSSAFRVGGTLPLLKQLLAAGFPVMIEESFYFEDPFWPNDDLWAAHYLLLTGYDDATQLFTGQDSFHGANQKLAYATLDSYWQIFNRVYLLVYLPSQEASLKAILGAEWDADTNRQHALEVSQAETQQTPDNAFAWFNLGSNLVYFDRYAEAVTAYDTARTLGLPQRMLRYQFGPFFAYFNTLRTDDLLALTDYALQRTPNSEEALLWHGWALYRQGDTDGAIHDWRKAVDAHPGYEDALYALNFVGASP